MIVLAGLIAGGVLGLSSARRRGGNRLDLAQYTAVGAILGGILGLFATIGIERML
ncbi:hypothetical protein [Rhodobaculum claviforme]|uniref:Uncharacterized protein n=1 Tax=Rhodobaculum claviforme TaxID=1549854 RepID=A0A934TI33_9RHOB|nr:hypothetical protein [Rhodobaculum claviforme]MBK5926109.1 hypothetical protein [Rhodobaculum claviforme]